MHYVYILRSSQDGKIYYGYTNDLEKRIAFHESGKVLATMGRLPLKLIYCEAFLSEEDARARERYFKTGWGRAYIKKHLRGTLQIAKVAEAKSDFWAGRPLHLRQAQGGVCDAERRPSPRNSKYLYS